MLEFHFCRLGGEGKLDFQARPGFWLWLSIILKGEDEGRWDGMVGGDYQRTERSY